MQTFPIDIIEFRDLEVVVGLIETDGTETFRLGRFADGKIGFAIDRDGERGVVCRLDDWVASLREQTRPTGSAATREP